MMKKRPAWSTGGELVRSFQFRTGNDPDRMAILASVWDRELGHLARHWTLAGVRRGIVLVKPRSAAAAQELQLRAVGLVRGLNKHFSKPWIKGIKTTP